MALHELSERNGNGITVRLWWESETDEVTVTYVDELKGESFTLYPARDKARDAFEHPNAWPTRLLRGTITRRVGFWWSDSSRKSSTMGSFFCCICCAICSMILEPDT